MYVIDFILLKNRAFKWYLMGEFIMLLFKLTQGDLIVWQCKCVTVKERRRYSGYPPFIAINNVFYHILVTLFWARLLCVCFKKWLFRTPAFISSRIFLLFFHFFYLVNLSSYMQYLGFRNPIETQLLSSLWMATHLLFSLWRAAL